MFAAQILLFTMLGFLACLFPQPAALVATAFVYWISRQRRR